MALRNVVKIGEAGEAVLYKKTRKIERFDERLETLANDMIETMHDGDGIGLAASQVGILKSIFVMSAISEEGDLVIINPEITAKEGEEISYEGCLSLPQMFGKVKRAQKITIKYQDLTGKEHEMVAEDLKARCIQHEVDHLDGIMFTDKMIGELVHESQLQNETVDKEDKEG